MEAVEMAPRTNRPPIRSLTSLRFVAALWVVWFHFGQEITPRLLAPVAELGYLGVTFFFVLSGFVLTYTYIHPDRPINRAGFIDARIARIAPLYYLSLAFSFPIFVAAYYPLGPSDLLSIAATLLAIQVWIPSALFSWNFPSWSVGSEVFFYALFPFVAVALSRIAAARMLFLYSGLMVVSVIPSLVVVSLGATSVRVDKIVGYNPAIHFQEFVIGVVAALLYMRGRFMLPRRVARVAVMMSPLIAVVVAFPLAEVPRLIVQSGVTAPLFAGLILCFATVDPQSGFIAGRLPVLLGGASYAVYLFHAPTWAYLARLLGQDAEGMKTDPALVMAYLVLLVGGCILLHVRYEEPLRRGIRARRSNRRLRRLRPAAAAEGP